MDNIDYKDDSFEANGKIINYEHAVVNPVKEDLINLNEQAKKFIKYSLEDADDLLKTLLSGNKSLSNYTATDLDELLHLWNNQRQLFKFTEENQFVNAIGAAFGNYLNKEFATEWIIISSEEYGTDYACKSTGDQDFKSFPFSSTWKTVEQKRKDSLNAIVEIVRKNIEDWSKKQLSK